MSVCRDCYDAITLMNRLSGRRYGALGSNVRNLHARHKEYGVEAVDAVVRKKAAAWLGDLKMRVYFRPSTLFRPGHFDEYLNEPQPVPVQTSELDAWGRCNRCTDYGHGASTCMSPTKPVDESGV